MKIDIPEILIHLRGKVVKQGGAPLMERLGMKAAAMAFAGGERLETAQQLARLGQKPFVHDGAIRSLPGMLGAWTATRDLRPIPRESFRNWWAKREKQS